MKNLFIDRLLSHIISAKSLPDWRHTERGHHLWCLSLLLVLSSSFKNILNALMKSGSSMLFAWITCSFSLFIKYSYFNDYFQPCSFISYNIQKTNFSFKVYGFKFKHKTMSNHKNSLSSVEFYFPEKLMKVIRKSGSLRTL